MLQRAHVKIVARSIYTYLFFSYTYTPLFRWKRKSNCDRCFPQQIRLRVKKSMCNVWILKLVNLHCNWNNLITVLNFPKQWVADYRRVFRTLSSSKMECLSTKVNRFEPLTIFAKHSILDVWQGSQYAPGLLKLFCRVSKRDKRAGWYMPAWL